MGCGTKGYVMRLCMATTAMQKSLSQKTFAENVHDISCFSKNDPEGVFSSQEPAHSAFFRDHDRLLTDRPFLPQFTLPQLHCSAADMVSAPPT